MQTIEDHIQHDKKILEDPLTNPAARRHYKEEIKAGDHHDPNALELFCDMHPDEPECLVYDD